jgi:uroporphyrinogen decarboxylase
MTRREQLLEVYKHKNIGYVPCFFTDFDFSKPAEINERPEQGGTDWFGVEWEFVPAVMAPMVKPGTKRLTDICNWKEELVFPDLNAVDWEAAAAKETANWDRENKISFMMLINGIFERTHALMGFEDALCAMYEEPEAYKELIDAITDYKIEVIKIIGKYYKPDVLSFHDDFGSNDRMLMSVELWEEFFKEPLRRVIEETHRQGIIYEHHSCGYIEPIFDQLVELGIDAIDPLQIKNPLRQLKDKYQDRVTFAGGYDNQGVYDKPGVTEDEIRAETKRTMDELAPGGSFVAFPLTITFDFVPTFIDEHMKNAFSYGE